MKKKEFELFLEEVIKEALKEFYAEEEDITPKGKSLFSLYRKSARHPERILKKTLSRKRNWRQLFEPSDVFVSSAQDKEFLPVKLSDISGEIKDYLNNVLRTQQGNPIAYKVLKGFPISRRDAATLGRVLMQIPGFNIHQPRKLIDLLLLLVIENGK